MLKQTDESPVTERSIDASVIFERAQKMLTNNEAASALLLFELILDSTPDSIKALLGIQSCLFSLGRHEEATTYTHKLAELSSKPDALETPSTCPRKAATTKHLNMVPGNKKSIPTNILTAFPIAERKIGFSDVVGMKDLKNLVRLKIIEPFLNPSLFARFSQKSGGGILLYGPPGCGKTYLAKAIATECDAEFISVGISDVLSMWIGETESQLAAIFEKARHSKPCVLFFDELDALAFCRSKSQADHSRTLVNEFLTQMDGIGKSNDQILILGATNMPWNIDSALKRPGRFSRQIFVPPPDEDARALMFEMKLRNVPTAEVNFMKLASTSALFSGADIDGVIEEVKERVLAEIIESGQDQVISEQALLETCKAHNPSCIDWLKTARNLVMYGGADKSYADVERYLKNIRLI